MALWVTILDIGYDVLHSDTLANAVMAIGLIVGFVLHLTLRSGINWMEAD